MATAPNFRPIGWNGISCLLPEGWNVIVKGNRHLIIEHRLHPLLEFRWQKNGRCSPGVSHTERILSRIYKETEITPEVVEPPAFLQKLSCRYEVDAFRLNRNLPFTGAIMTCRKCGTPVLFQFFDTTMSSIDCLSSFFSTFSCCQAAMQKNCWAIEDLSFKIPGSFKLDACSFSLGLAQLSFKKSGASLTLIRLSAASKHIKQHTLQQLFANFHGGGLDHAIQPDESTLLLDARPSFIDYLLKIIKRKKIYRWAKFFYCTEKNKILGIRMESSCPLDRQQIAFIEKNYESIY